MTSTSTAPRRRRPVATVTMLAEATGKAPQVVSKSLQRPEAPPRVIIPGIGPLFDEADAIRYLTQQRQGQPIVPPEQYQMHRDVRAEILARFSGDEAAARPALRRALRYLQEPWQPAPLGPDHPEGYVALTDAGARARRGKTTASARLKDTDLMARYGVHVVQLRSLRVFYPVKNVIAMLEERHEGGSADWPVERKRYHPPARRHRNRETAGAAAG
jgi:hypothetical protein